MQFCSLFKKVCIIFGLNYPDTEIIFSNRSICANTMDWNFCL